MNLFKTKELLKNRIMKRFRVEETFTYKIYDSEKGSYWQVCFNDWNTEDKEVAIDHCRFMNKLHDNAHLEDSRYRNYIRKKHK